MEYNIQYNPNKTYSDNLDNEVEKLYDALSGTDILELARNMQPNEKRPRNLRFIAQVLMQCASQFLDELEEYEQ